MRIEEEVKLDYSDVLFRPKRSTLSSRKDVDLNRTYKFRYSNNEWTGIPIMAANMDGVGELGVAEKLSEFNMITCLTKQHDIKQLKHSLSIISVFRKTVLIRSALFIVFYILLIKNNASIITSIPLVLLLIMIYSISSLALRENIDRLDKSLENIIDIEKIK